MAEGVGELSGVIRKDKIMKYDKIKGTVEELSDVLHYTVMIANTYDIDLETVL